MAATAASKKTAVLLEVAAVAEMLPETPQTSSQAALAVEHPVYLKAATTVGHQISLEVAAAASTAVPAELRISLAAAAAPMAEAMRTAAAGLPVEAKTVLSNPPVPRGIR